MGTIDVKGIAGILKAMIDRNGPSYLADEPYRVYEELLDSGVSDRKTAAAILYVLVSGIMNDFFYFLDAGELSEFIRRESSLNKRMADRLALILAALYTGNQIKEWQDKEKEGLRLFLEEEFICSWDGFAVWDAGNGTVDCHYEAQIKLMPTEMILKDEELAGQIEKNPFMTKEAIHNLFENRLAKHLDKEFEYYCTCEEYYEPTVEDFDTHNLPEWCEKNGFEFLSFEGDGYDEGYVPKHIGRWY